VRVRVNYDVEVYQLCCEGVCVEDHGQFDVKVGQFCCLVFVVLRVRVNYDVEVGQL